MKQRIRIRLVWSCSDFVKHEHRTQLGAWLCSRVQAVAATIRPRKPPREEGEAAARAWHTFANAISEEFEQARARRATGTDAA